MSPAATDRRRQRIASLDGLRGLAAMMVLLAHSISALAKTPESVVALHQSPIAILANAGGGVHIFFVLSGFCLCAPARMAWSWLRLSDFYGRRILRIHLPYMVGLMIAWILSGWVYDRSQDIPALSEHMEELRRIHIRPHALRYALRFPGEAFSQIPVGWTLRVEMIYSFALPLMLWIALRLHWGLLIAISIPALVLDATDATFIRYAINFSLGITIYCERERLEAFTSRFPTPARGLLLGAGLLMLTLPVFLMIVGSHPKTTDALQAAGAGLLVMGTIHAPGLRAFLSLAPLAWLGKVSYSVYLIHVPVIILLTTLLHDRLDFWQGSLFVLACGSVTLLVAPFLYLFVEAPAIQLGYRLHDWLAIDREDGGDRR